MPSDLFRRGSFADSGRRHFRTHGASSTRLYRIWDSMRRRCENPNHAAYYLYGARGIRICEPWRTFEPFREWALAHGYKSGLSIDRIRSNGDYEPDNCQWITRSENTTRMHIDHGIRRRFRRRYATNQPSCNCGSRLPYWPRAIIARGGEDHAGARRQNDVSRHGMALGRLIRGDYTGTYAERLIRFAQQFYEQEIAHDEAQNRSHHLHYARRA